MNFLRAKLSLSALPPLDGFLARNCIFLVPPYSEVVHDLEATCPQNASTDPKLQKFLDFSADLMPIRLPGLCSALLAEMPHEPHETSLERHIELASHGCSPGSLTAAQSPGPLGHQQQEASWSPRGPRCSCPALLLLLRLLSRPPATATCRCCQRLDWLDQEGLGAAGNAGQVFAAAGTHAAPVWPVSRSQGCAGLELLHTQ